MEKQFAIKLCALFSAVSLIVGGVIGGSWSAQRSYNSGYNYGYSEGKEAGYQEGQSDKAAELSAYQYTLEDMSNAYDHGYTRGESDALAASASTPSTSENTPADPPTKLTFTVYVTNTGSKYHRAGCQYLSKSCIPISFLDAQNQGYTACSRCW